MNNTQIANLVTIGGVSVMLGIAGFTLPISLTVLGATTLGCAYLTTKK